MKHMCALALAAALGFGGMTIAASHADAQGRSGGFNAGGGIAGGFGGGMNRGFAGGMNRGWSGGMNRGFSGGMNRGFTGPRNFSGNPGWSGRNWAGRNWSGNKWAGRGWKGGHWKHAGKWRRHHRNRFFYAAPFVAGAYYYGSSYGDCDWLYDRAVTTGSSYWWSRYNECIYDY